MGLGRKIRIVIKDQDGRFGLGMEIEDWLGSLIEDCGIELEIGD